MWDFLYGGVLRVKASLDSQFWVYKPVPQAGLYAMVLSIRLLPEMRTCRALVYRHDFFFSYACDDP